MPYRTDRATPNTPVLRQTASICGALPSHNRVKQKNNCCDIRSTVGKLFSIRNLMKHTSVVSYTIDNIHEMLQDKLR